MKEDPVIKINGNIEPDEEDLLLQEALGGIRSADAMAEPEPTEEKEDIPLDAIVNKGIIYSDEIVQEREGLLSRVRGKTFGIRYRWFLWDDPSMCEAGVMEGCRALVEDHCLLIYDESGDLKYNLPINRVMFRAFPNLINVAWFDEELDSVYYSIEMFVELF